LIKMSSKKWIILKVVEVSKRKKKL
jgi:hypothetical protein